MSGFTRPANAAPLVGNLDVTSGDYLRNGQPLLASGNGFIDGEIPAGAIDNVNVVYVVAYPPYMGSIQVFVNGLLQRAGASEDYTISGATITFNTPLSAGSVIVVSYRK